MTNTIAPSQDHVFRVPDSAAAYIETPVPQAERGVSAGFSSPQEVYATNDGRVINREVVAGVVAEAERHVANIYAATPEAIAASAAEKAEFEQAALERATAFSKRIGLMQEGALRNEGVNDSERERYGLAA